MEKENKGFVISDEDLKIFQEWIKKPDSIKKILESHSDKMKKLQPFFDRLDRMVIHTPFTI